MRLHVFRFLQSACPEEDTKVPRGRERFDPDIFKLMLSCFLRPWSAKLYGIQPQVRWAGDINGHLRLM